MALQDLLIKYKVWKSIQCKAAAYILPSKYGNQAAWAVYIYNT